VQLAFFCVCALAHGFAFARWRLRSKEDHSHSWVLYGWFTGLSFCGSAAGVLAYGIRLHVLKLFYVYSILHSIVKPTLDEQLQMQILIVQNRRWNAAFYALFPFELCFVVVCKLLVLHRVQHLAISGESHAQRWRKASRGLLAIVVLLNTLGICGNFGAAFYFSQAADLHENSAIAFAANNTAEGQALRGEATKKNQYGIGVASTQRFSEVSVLMMIILSFVTVGFFSARVIASALHTLFTAQQRLVAIAGAAGEQGRDMVAAASLQGRQLQRKVIGTFVFVFMTLLVRSVFTFLFAVAQALQDTGNPCAISFCDPCHNVYSNIQGWIVYTPAFQMVTMLVASPVALLVALWGMSGVGALEQMSSSSVRTQLEMNSRAGLSQTNHFFNP
jgi:hypothetical protein